MLQRRTMIWGLVCAVFVAALAATGLLRRKPPPPPLPELAAYPQLPGAFAERLRAVRAQVAVHPADAGSWRSLAGLYQANRLYAPARACYRSLARSGAKLSARDHYYLADIAQNDGDLGTAQMELRLVLAAEPTYLPARLTLAETLFKSGSADEAARVWQAILTDEPDQPEASVGLARVELQQAKEEAAVTRLERLLGAHLDCVSGAALLSQILRRRGETERAAALTSISQQKHALAPSDPWLEELLADCYDPQRLSIRFEELLNSGHPEAAQPLLDRVEALAPNSWTPPLFRGWALARAHQDRDAVPLFHLALERGGDPERIVPLAIASMVALGQTKEATAFAADQFARNPQSTDILNAYAGLAVRTGDVPRAKDLLTRLLRKDPYLYTANMSLAKLLWSSGGRDEAVACVRRVVLAFPGDVASRGLLAQHLLEHNDPRAAIPPLEQAIPVAGPGAARERLTAMLERAYLQVAEAEAAAGRLAAAAGYFSQAGQLVPTAPEALAGEAGVATQLRQFRRAAAALAKLATLQPDNPTVELSLGDVLYQNNEAEVARRHWARALQLAAAGDADLRAALRERLDGRITADTFR